jgi:hypothetical protein
MEEYMAKAQTEARDIAPFPEGVAIVCPGCGGFEMAATRSSLADRDWTWIGKAPEGLGAEERQPRDHPGDALRLPVQAETGGCLFPCLTLIKESA